MSKELFSARRKFLVLLLIATVAGLVFLAGCTEKTETTVVTQTNSGESSTDADTTELPAHTVNPNPTPLGETESTLSLEGYGAEGALADKSLSIADMLVYAIQDEYLAHGEYQAIIAKFGNVRPFSNIVTSEETHIAYLNEIFTAYKMEIPPDDSAGHVVVPGSLLEANQTCVQAEIDNIAMYERFLTYDLPDDVKTAFEALKSASEKHLQSFQKQVDKLS